MACACHNKAKIKQIIESKFKTPSQDGSANKIDDVIAALRKKRLAQLENRENELKKGRNGQ